MAFLKDYCLKSKNNYTIMKFLLDRSNKEWFKYLKFILYFWVNIAFKFVYWTSRKMLIRSIFSVFEKSLLDRFIYERFSTWETSNVNYLKGQSHSKNKALPDKDYS